MKFLDTLLRKHWLLLITDGSMKPRTSSIYTYIVRASNPYIIIYFYTYLYKMRITYSHLINRFALVSRTYVVAADAHAGVLRISVNAITRIILYKGA